MAPGFASQFRQLWHELTSNDRHASHDSPYRSGKHVALPQNRHAPLTSVATSALDSRVDLDNDDSESANGFVNNSGPASPNSAYSPGMRGTLQRQASAGMDSKMEGVSTGEIQMQNFSDGLPPPPPVGHSWKRIDRWLEDNYEELFENLGEPATANDVNELEHDMDCTLPQEVRESLQTHDGQERGGRPTGIIFGCMILDCEEIMQEWTNWRTINEVYFGEGGQPQYEIPQAPLKAFAGSSSSSASVPVAQPPQQGNSGNPHWRSDLQDRQDSQPTNAIQKAYAHPAWIPLARDWGGNNICVDLAPGPTGRWGQVILMGRDYDCKYVVSRSWSAFLATLADDMQGGKAFIDEETSEFKLREFPKQDVDPAYIDILRWRADQKFGRKQAPKKRPLRINPQAGGGASGQQAVNGLSPYGSPTSGPEDNRGRSPHRVSGNGKQPATGSPRAHMSSPLAKVTEEAASPQKGKSEPAQDSPNLMSVDTPAIGTDGTDDAEKRASLPKSKLGNNVLSSTEESAANDTPTAKAEQAEEGATVPDSNAMEDEMREVKI